MSKLLLYLFFCFLVQAIMFFAQHAIDYEIAMASYENILRTLGAAGIFTLLTHMRWFFLDSRVKNVHAWFTVGATGFILIVTLETMLITFSNLLDQGLTWSVASITALRLTAYIAILHTVSCWGGKWTRLIWEEGKVNSASLEGI